MSNTQLTKLTLEELDTLIAQIEWVRLELIKTQAYVNIKRSNSLVSITQ
jgi:hypothetical protein